MRLSNLSYALILLLLFASCQKTVSRDKSEIETAITAVLHEQLRDWNVGDVGKFMAGYYRSDSLRFASGGNVFHGWQPTLEGHKERYPDKRAMGTISF